MEALQASEEGLGGVLDTPQIEAIYVDCVQKTAISMDNGKTLIHGTSKPEGRWFITLKYLPPDNVVMPWGEGKISAKYSTVLNEVDAFNGDWVTAVKTTIGPPAK